VFQLLLVLLRTLQAHLCPGFDPVFLPGFLVGDRLYVLEKVLITTVAKMMDIVKELYGNALPQDYTLGLLTFSNDISLCLVIFLFSSSLSLL
jgi:hypothetical protein